MLVSSSVISLLNRDVSGFRNIHLWTHGAAAPFNIYWFHTGQRWTADCGAKGLSLQTVAVCAAVNVPSLLVCIGLAIEVTDNFLWNSILYAVWTALPLPQNWSFTGHRRTGLRVAADHPIHADTASANIGFPRLSCQENVSLVILAVAGQTVIARYGRLKKFILAMRAARVLSTTRVLTQ